MADIIDDTLPKDIDLVGLGALKIRETREAVNTLKALVDNSGSAFEYIDGCQVYTEKITNANNIFNQGILKLEKGVVNIGAIALTKTAVTTITIGSNLTPSRWYVVYIDNAGNLTVELTTASDANVFPTATLDTDCPYESKGLARYKAGDATKRALAIAYSLATPTAYNSGTAYKVDDRCEYNGNVYVCILAGTNKQPDTNPLNWQVMGASLRLFTATVNITEKNNAIFGLGLRGDVVLDGTGLGATATPFYGLRENIVAGPDVYPEYEFNNLTINGVCYCGKSDGLSLDPVVIRVKGTLTIGASGQLNGDARGANGASGGVSAGSTGANGGAGAKSGRPIQIYANKIIDLRTSGYWLTTQAGNPSAGANGGASNGFVQSGGGGGGGGSSTSSILIITNSVLSTFSVRINKLSSATPAYGGTGGALYSATWLHGLNGTAGTLSKHQLGGKGGRTGVVAGTINYGGEGGEGGGIGCGGGASGGSSGAGGNGGVPTLSHVNLGDFIIIDKYDSREVI